MESVSFRRWRFLWNPSAHAFSLTGQCCSAIQFKRWKLKPNEQIPFENPYYVPRKPGADSDFYGMVPTDRQIASDESQTPSTEPTNNQISSNESTDSQTSPTEPVDNQISSNEHIGSPVSSNTSFDNQDSSNQPIDVQISSNEATDNQISLNEPTDSQTSPREDPDTSTKWYSYWLLSDHLSDKNLGKTLLTNCPMNDPIWDFTFFWNSYCIRDVSSHHTIILISRNWLAITIAITDHPKA